MNRATHTGETAPPLTGWRSTFAALGYRNFRLLWLTTIFTSSGNWVQQVTLGWLAYDITKSPVQVALVMGVRAVPMLSAPLSGVIADRFDRRRLLMLDPLCSWRWRWRSRPWSSRTSSLCGTCTCSRS